MAQRDLDDIQRRAEELSPAEKRELALYLLSRAGATKLKPTGDLSEFRGAIKLTIDPLEFQQGIRAEWP